jgi:hypothetical protein
MDGVDANDRGQEWTAIFETRFEAVSFVVGHLLFGLFFLVALVGDGALPDWSFLFAFGLAAVGVVLLNLSLRSIAARRVSGPRAMGRGSGRWWEQVMIQQHWYRHGNLRRAWRLAIGERGN